MKFFNKSILLTLIFALCVQNIKAQKGSDNELPFINVLNITALADFEYHDYRDGSDDAYGFNGKYFIIDAGGNITDNLSYFVRHKVRPYKGISSFFDNTDYLLVTYKLNDNWSFTLGKNEYLMGSFEFDSNPTDVFYYSHFGNNLNCFNVGGSITFKDSDAKNIFDLQVINSPYMQVGNGSLLSYNLRWKGNYEHFKTMYSLNMHEYAKGSYIKYIALGNKLKYDKWEIYVDAISRATDVKDIFGNISVFSQLDVNVCDRLSLFVKGGYEKNDTEINDYTSVAPGSEYVFYGLGTKFYPSRDSNFRLHAFVAAQDDGNNISLQYVVGVKWRIDFASHLNKLN